LRAQGFSQLRMPGDVSGAPVAGQSLGNGGQEQVLHGTAGGGAPQCVARSAELEPSVRVPHTVYVKTFYRIGGQDYCRQHIIRATVAGGVIAEVKPDCGTMWCG